MKPAHHLLDIYEAHLWLATTAKQYRTLATRFEGQLEHEDTLGIGCTSLIVDREHSTPHLAVYVNARAHRGNPLAVVTTCAHEAAHVATMLLVHLGHQIRREDEPHAYLVGWTTAWLIEQVGRHEARAKSRA